MNRISISGMKKKDFEYFIKDYTEREYDINTVIFQTAFFKEVEEETLKLFNQLILTQYPNTSFRIYPEDDDVDLSNIRYLSNIKRLEIEGNIVANTKCLGALKKLETLEISVRHIDNFDFLKELTNLKILGLYNTKTVKPSISAVKYLQKLEVLNVEKYKNGLESIKELKSLKKLIMNGQKIKTYDFLPNHKLEYVHLPKIKEYEVDYSSIKSDKIMIGGVDINKKTEEELSDVNLPFELTNHERKYLGLEPVEDHWDLVKLNEYNYMYFDGNTIKRCIKVGNDSVSYSEFQYHIETDNREMILPKTAKGKPKKLNWTNFQTCKEEGVYFRYRTSDNTFMIGNCTSQLSLFESLFFDVPLMKDYKELRTFIGTYIEETTEKNLEELERFKKSKRKRIKYKAGDFFRIKIGRSNKYMYGRILISLAELRKYKEFSGKYKNYGLHLMTVPVIAKTYRYTGEEEIDLHTLRTMESFPSYITMDNNLLYGEHEIIGHLPLEAVDLQEMWISYSRSIDGLDKDTFYLQWGMIYCETHIDNVPEHLRTSQFRHEGVGSKVGFKDAEEFYDCLEKNSNDPYWDVKTHGRFDDLRNPRNKETRDEILDFFGLNPKLNYAENLKIWLEGKEDRAYLDNYRI